MNNEELFLCAYAIWGGALAVLAWGALTVALAKHARSLRAEVRSLRSELELNTGDEPDTSDCCHPDTCGFCRARESTARKLREASRSTPSSYEQLPRC